MTFLFSNAVSCLDGDNVFGASQQAFKPDIKSDKKEGIPSWKINNFTDEDLRLCRENYAIEFLSQIFNFRLWK